MRLDHYLVSHSPHSRRDLYRWLTAGLIYHNNRRCTQLTHRVHHNDSIRVDQDDIRVKLPSVFRLYAYHKPTGVIATRKDPKGRRCLDSVCDRCPVPVFPVGRLDRASSGLLLLTNNGALAQRLMHPQYETPKYYTIILNKRLIPAHQTQLCSGLFLDDGPARFDTLDAVQQSPPTYTICLHSGRNRIIRRSFDALRNLSLVRCVRRVPARVFQDVALDYTG